MAGVELHQLTAWLMVAALVVYALTGGADFGGGAWDLLAFGRREQKRAQRDLIEKAIGPIWEANHVWLIALIVVMFVCFPRAFAAMGVALHIPLTLMLLGIVMRGSSFVFRAYGAETDGARRLWGRVFSVSSVVTPFLLGMSLAAIASGRLVFDEAGVYRGGVRDGWLGLFPAAVGLMVVSAFAHLAAVYLCVEAAASEGTDARGLAREFRVRAWWSALVVFVAGGLARLAAIEGAPVFGARLGGSWWSLPLAMLPALTLGSSCLALRRERWRTARLLSAATIAILVAGFGLAQFPYLVAPGFTIGNSAAPPVTQALTLGAFGLGALILIPSLIYLMRVFKGRTFGAGGLPSSGRELHQ